MRIIQRNGKAVVFMGGFFGSPHDPTIPSGVLLHAMASIYVFLGLIGNITAMIMFLSPTPTLWRIIRSRDTGSFSPIPYACTLLNCLLWLFYAVPAVTSNNTLIITINGAGVTLEFIYLLLFLAFAPASHRAYLSMLLLAVMGGFAAVVAITLSAFEKYDRANFVGVVCVLVGTLMYASPLSVMKLVIATRSVEYMPFPLSLCSMINALLWTSYGVLKHDKFLIIPNTLGSLLGLLQLAIYAHYKGETETESNFHQIPDYAAPLRGTGKLKHAKSANSYLK